MKKYLSLKKLIKLFIFFLIIGILFIGIQYHRAINSPLKSNEDTVIIEVKDGDGFYDLLDRLESQGKLSNKMMIKLRMNIHKQNIQLAQGIYEVDKNSTLTDVIKCLEDSSENKNLIKLTIPEGYSVEEIAQEVENKGIDTKENFIEAVKNYECPSFIKQDSLKRYNLEGYLYPDTYLIPNGSDSNHVIGLMVNEFKSVFDTINTTYEANIADADVEKIVTIASMIEKEARVDKDRPYISSVIYNRLNDDMKLQIDATVLYALGYHVDLVLNKHLEIDSPYNTYKYKGLPQGPIANPGRAALIAAVKPAYTEYIYYILEKDGSHYFTNDYNDFLEKKQELGY